MAPQLLTLPGEVKNAIYEYCIDDEATVEITADRFLNNIKAWHKEWKVIIFEGRPEQKEGAPKEFALAKTCRQIRFEVLPILAEFGHSCLYVPLYGPFNPQMMEPLPQPYVGNIRELRLWKTAPTLKGQTLTPALPALESLILDFHPQFLTKSLGRQFRFRDWPRFWCLSYMMQHNVIGTLKKLAAKTYACESDYLNETEPDREIGLQLRIPYGSFSVPVQQFSDVSCLESDRTLVSGATVAGRGN